MISKLARRSADLLVVRVIPLLLIMLFVLFPFYWTLNTALKHESDVVKLPVRYLPAPATLKNFVTAWNSIGFAGYFTNSLIVAVATVAVVIVLSALTGYALSRFRFHGKSAFMFLLLCTQFFPGAVLLIPLYLELRAFGLINSLMSLVVVYTLFQLPFNAILMRGFISNVPREIEEAARVDGCGLLVSLARITLPLLLPGIVATSAFAFIGCWNEFLFALMFLNKKSLMTIPIGLALTMGEFDINYATLAASGIIALVPAVVMFAYIQKYLIQGLSAGSVKG